MLLLAGSVVAGSVIGTGVARTAVDVGDGLSWLADSPSGQVIEVNPATGKPQSSVQMGAPGQGLTVAQDRGRLVVSNSSTGAITSIDLATLVATGRRAAPAGDQSSVLLSDGRAFLVDRANSSIAAIDPVTMATIGRIWVVDQGLSDAVVDQRGALWAVSRDGTVVELAWSDESKVFVEKERKTFPGTGSQARLVPHEHGVTLVSPDTGAVVQVGTGHDLVSAAPRMRGTIVPATSSDSSLVPVSATQTGTVVIVEDLVVREVDGASVGCPRPGRPAVFDEVVYVPCLGSGRVVRLGPDGSKAGPDIVTPGGKDAEVLVDDGVVLVNVPGSSSGVRIGSDGSTSTFVRYDPAVKPTNVDRKDVPAPDTAEKQAAADREKSRNDRKDDDHRRYDPNNGLLPVSSGGTKPRTTGTPRPTGSDPTSTGTSGSNPTTTTPSTPTTPAGPEPQAPADVAARAEADGTVTVSWSHGGPAAGTFEILVNGSSAVTAGGDSRQTVLRGLAPGGSVQVAVRAVFTGSSQVSGTVGVTPHTVPGQAGNVRASESSRTRSSVTVSVSWDPAAANGSAITGYRVSASGGYAGSGKQVEVSGTSGALTLPCPDSSASCGSGAVTITVTPLNSVGSGPGASTSFTPSGTPRLDLPGNGDTVITNAQSDGADEYSRSMGVTITLAPPGSWAGFGGVCKYVQGTLEKEIPCSSTEVTSTVTRATLRRTSSSHSAVVRAYDPLYPDTVVASATYSWTESWPVEPIDCTPTQTGCIPK